MLTRIPPDDQSAGQRARLYSRADQASLSCLWQTAVTGEVYQCGAVRVRTPCGQRKRSTTSRTHRTGRRPGGNGPSNGMYVMTDKVRFHTLQFTKSGGVVGPMELADEPVDAWKAVAEGLFDPARRATPRCGKTIWFATACHSCRAA